MGGNGVFVVMGIECIFPIIIGNYREIIEDLSEICWLERCGEVV